MIFRTDQVILIYLRLLTEYVYDWVSGSSSNEWDFKLPLQQVEFTFYKYHILGIIFRVQFLNNFALEIVSFPQHRYLLTETNCISET